MAESESRQIPAHAVDRPGLRAQLDAGLTAPLSLVVAPAGAGKTLLLSQWARSRQDLAVAWVDVSPADVEAFVFARHLVGAIAAACTGFHAPVVAVETTGRRFGEPFLEDLAEGMTEAGRVVMVFDDLDRLAGTPLLTDLWRLVDLLPPSVHCIFSSRVDLQLGWSRHRLQHGMVEVRERELAFDVDTTTRVLEAITGQAVTPETAAVVVDRTEGWAVGVQLTALSLRFTDDPRRIVDTLSETDRLVIDYLSEEVLDAQHPDRREALIKLSAVDTFCPALVDAIIGEGGAEFIAGLERDSMFLVPLPAKAGWYRFHRLFRDLLRLRLRAADAHIEARLLAIAADWSEAEGRSEEAIEYNLRARRWEQAIDGILRLGRVIYEDRRTGAVAGWLAQVPDNVRRCRPAADVMLAMAEGMSGRATEAIDLFRTLLSEDRLTVGERQAALAYLAACVQFAPHAEFFVDVARRSLALLRQEPDAEVPDLLGLTGRPLLCSVSEVSLGRGLLFLGDLPGARRALLQALDGDGLAYRPYRVHILGSLGIVECLSGRLRTANGYADEALALAGEFGLLAHPATADAFIARALVAVSRGLPEAGAFALQEGTVRAMSNERTQLLWLAHLASLLIDPPVGDAVPTEPIGPAPPIVRQAITALEMRRARLRGSPTVPHAPATAWSFVAFEEVAALLAVGQPTAARTRLAQMATDPDPHAPAHMIELDLLLAWACDLEGRGAQSRSHLQSALSSAEPEWLVRSFSKAGAEVANLIDALPGPAGEFRRLVVLQGRAGGAPRQQPLLDKLTPRELELLAYLPSRMTIPDIATHSFVSINTIKTHMGHIYRKLGVTGRDAAIVRATELGLIEPGDIARVG